MALSWNEIKTRAAAFVNEWKDKAPTAREEADAQTFETGFFRVFGVERSQVAIFEQKVRLSGEANGYIDLFWKGHIMIEMKSPGKDMSKAFEQAKNYANALKPADLPKGILICDFNRFHYYDLLDNAKRHEFALSELVQYVELFGDLAGYKDVEYKKQDAVNIEAAEKMGRLHDRLKEIGYAGHQLEVYLVRILFCLFADDTGIFEHDSFIKYILQRTNEDGSDLALHLQKIFEVLNKPQDKRLKTIDEQLDKFPYVNGGLFEETLEIADFDSGMREAIVECCTLDWGKISPAIFGSMFQSVMNEKERRNLGAHYTSEENILKLIHPLFLDDLWAEFDKYKALKSDVRIARLNEFHEKLARLKFLDPACGCGNFLIITYREIRILELSVIKELLGGERILDVDTYVKVNVNQFYGIEIEEFPSKIAQVAMWLMDHQMNMLVRDMFGEYYVRIPLRASPSIVCANSLRTDWESVVPKNELSYILGNPPFVGARIMSDEQKSDLEYIFDGLKNSGNLDYVTCWYKKAALFIQGTDIEVAFVSTNSICQGEQVPILWPELMNKYGVKINFAHTTFRWSNEARGKAAVYCVIVGFGLTDRKAKKLYHYADVDGQPAESLVKQISAYLVDAAIVFVDSRKSPICNVPPMLFGNMPNDGGNFLLNEAEYHELINNDNSIGPFIRVFLGAEDFLHNQKRYCFWLKDLSPNSYKKHSVIVQRIEAVRRMREESSREATRMLSKYPMLFGEIRQPETSYILIPRHSSERRRYIPIGFLDKDTIAGDSNIIIPDASLYEFGVITSTMHMAWMRYVCGRLEMRYRYSASIVYNNFPWPNPSDKQKSDIEEAAQGVLDARAKFPDSSLADLYDPDLMPPDLVKAHAKLDRLVEKAYGKSFSDDAERVAFLFEEYRKLTEGLFAKKAK
jgi:type I restriction-modification system DNA methylase subunit